MPKNDDFEARRKSRQREIRRRRRKKAFVVFIMLCFLTIIVLSLTVFFKVQTVKVSGSDLYEKAEITNAASVIGKNLFLISGTKLEEKIRLSLPYVDEIKIRRALPHTLKIEVTDASPYSFYKSKGKYYIASKKGYILEETKSGSDDLLEIKCSEAVCTVGKMVTVVSEREQKLITELTEKLEEMEIPANSIDVSNPASIKLRVDKRFDVNLGTKDYLLKKLAHLKGMIKSIESDKKGNIDLSMWTPENSQGSFLKK